MSLPRCGGGRGRRTGHRGTPGTIARMRHICVKAMTSGTWGAISRHMFLINRRTKTMGTASGVQYAAGTMLGSCTLATHRSEKHFTNTIQLATSRKNNCKWSSTRKVLAVAGRRGAKDSEQQTGRHTQLEQRAQTKKDTHTRTGQASNTRKQNTHTQRTTTPNRTRPTQAPTSKNHQTQTSRAAHSTNPPSPSTCTSIPLQTKNTEL